MRYLIVWGKHGWEVIDKNNCTVCTTARTWAEALQKKIALEERLLSWQYANFVYFLGADDALDKKYFA